VTTKSVFGEREGEGGVAWPPRSADWVPLNHFLWGHYKSVIYENPLEAEEDLVARILTAYGLDKQARDL
jgi:hypothetical protein